MERPTTWTLLCWAWQRMAPGKAIHYFNTPSAGGRLLARLWGVQLLPVDYFLGDLRTENGSATWYQLFGQDLTQICDNIRIFELEKSCFLRRLIAWGLEQKRLLLFLEKKVWAEIRDSAVHINVAACHARHGRSAEDEIVYFSPRQRWSQYLVEYAQSKGVRLVCTASVPHLRLGQVLLFWGHALLLVPRLLVRRPQRRAATGPTLAIAYSGRGLSTDPTKRNDLFWWNDSVVPPGQLLIYFTRSDLKLTQDLADFLRAQGIHFVAAYPGASQLTSPVWRPTGAFLKKGLWLWTKILAALVVGIFRRGPAPLAWLPFLGTLVFHYAFWFDFYRWWGIKAAVIFDEFSFADSIGGTMALQDLNAISLTYQASNLSCAPINIVPSSMIVLGFSAAFSHYWATFRLPADHVVQIGYTYDGAFTQVVHNAREQRRHLVRNGARFIIAYLDENSSKDRDGLISDSDTAGIYLELIGRVLRDPELGLVCKPKKGKSLRQRLGPVSELLAKAASTGRVVLLEHIDTYPAEAGLVADLAIGELVGTTAALETRLAGTPTVLIDLMGLKEHPYYSWGKDRVVFDDWNTLFAKIASSRANPAANAAFGDWQPALSSLDPFRDGKAGLRMGSYIAALRSALASGCGPQDAACQANRSYADTWGADKVISPGIETPLASPGATGTRDQQT